MKVIKQSAHIVKDWPKMNLYERCEFAGRISHASEDKIKEGSAEEFVRRMVKLGHESVFEFARVKLNYIGESGESNPQFVNIRRMRENIKQKDMLLWNYGSIVSAVKALYPAFFDDVFEKPGINKNNFVEVADDWIPVVIVTNRAISHQLVRYRKDVVYLQQSQRYVKFRDDVEFIDPGVYFPDRSEVPWDEPEYEGGRFINHAMEVWKEAMERAEQDYIWLLSEGHSAQAARLVLPNSTATKLIMYASPDTWRHVFDQRISDKADPMIRELLEPLKEEFVKEGLL